MNELVLNAVGAYRAAKSALLSREAAYALNPDDAAARAVELALVKYDQARANLREQTRR
jgi:hypothetical protein